MFPIRWRTPTDHHPDSGKPSQTDVGTLPISPESHNAPTVPPPKRLATPAGMPTPAGLRWERPPQDGIPAVTLSHPFEHTIASNTCRYWFQLDLPVYLGTDVDVNPDRLVVWEELAGLPALPYPNSVRNSARSFCSRATASTSSTCASSYGRPDWATVGYSSSGGHPTWASAPSLPEEIPLGPSGPKRACLRGVPRRGPSLITPRSTTDLVSNRSPARRLRPIVVSPLVGMCSGHTSLRYSDSSCYPGCDQYPSLALRTRPASIWVRPKVTWPESNLLVGNFQIHEKLSWPNQPFLPKFIDPPYKNPCPFHQNSILVTGTNCNGYGIWVNKDELLGCLISFIRLTEPWRTSDT